MKKKYIYKILTVLFLGVGMNSCSSDFLKEYSQDLSRVQSVDDLNELLVGDCFLPKGYYAVENSYLTCENQNYAILHFMSDELQENTQLFSDPQYGNNGFRTEYFPYFTWQKDAFLDLEGKSTNESAENQFWTLAYNKINNCNMVIDAANGLSVSSENDEMRLHQVKGEAHFMRAFYYLTLANLYGKPYAPQSAETDLAVPVKTSSNVEDIEYQRATVAATYQQIVADLSEAEKQFENTTSPSSIYHAGMEAVYILRSRVALYMQDWQTAVDYAKKALDKDNYLFDLSALTADEYPMSKANKEVVYSNGSSCFGNVIYEKPKKQDDYDDYSPTWYISDDLYALFDDKDYRKHTYITTEDDPYNHRPTYHKIDNSISSYGVYKEVSDVFSIRTAEAYLNMAEALAQLGQDSEACTYLNLLRQSRIQGGSNVQLSGAELISFIRDERERELCLEGHRWFDLRRYMVDTKYPYTKVIDHTYTYYADNGHYEYTAKRIDHYRLEKNDAGYVLNIPKTVRDFQPSIGSNERPVRNIVQSVERPDNGDSDGGDDGDDDDE